MRNKLCILGSTLLLASAANAKIVGNETNVVSDDSSSQHEQIEGISSGANFLFSLGYTSGGDSLSGDIEFLDGTSDDVSAGTGLYLGVGSAYKFPDTPISVKGVVAYHLDSIVADVYGSNAELEIDFTRVELDLITQFHLNEKLFLGAGITRHLSMEYTQSVGSNKFKGELDDTFGYVVEAGYRGANAAISVRYTDISYESDQAINTIDASNFGIFLDWYL